MLVLSEILITILSLSAFLCNSKRFLGKRLQKECPMVC